jgi:hypothetical protein
MKIWAFRPGKATMATDYDAPQDREELNEDSIEELKTRRNDKNSGKVDEDGSRGGGRSFRARLPGKADRSVAALPVR